MMNKSMKCQIISHIIIVPHNICELHVGRIPGTVTYERLQYLFPQATSIHYHKGKITHDRIKLGYHIDNTHILSFRICFFLFHLSITGLLFFNFLMFNQLSMC